MQRRTLLAGGGAALVTAIAAKGQTAAPPIVLGSVSLSFYGVTGAVVRAVIERLGHRVELREGSHEDIFPLLEAQTIDLMAAVWLPSGHAAYWTRYGKDAVEVSKLYEGARFFWAVPAYVPVSEVNSIADLAKPGVANRMARTIQGIGPGAAISVLSQQAIGSYGLGETGYVFRTGTQSDWLAAYRDAFAKQQWFVFPTWAPQYLNRDGQMRPLLDPKGILGEGNRASLVAPRARFEKLPERTRRVLATMRLGIESVTSMDWDVNAGGKTPAQAAELWMAANQDVVESWFE